MAPVEAPSAASQKPAAKPVHRGPPTYIPPRGVVIAYLFFWMALGLALAVSSAGTLLAALTGAQGSGQVQRALQSGVELVASILFLVPRTLRLGGVILLIAFGVALSAHAREHRVPGRLLLAIAATVFVVSHGPVPSAWLGPRGGRRAPGGNADAR